MRKLMIILGVVAILVVVTLVLIPTGLRILAQRRPEPRMPTITILADFPKLPSSGAGLSKEQKDEAIQTLVNHKVFTYLRNSSRSYRAGKFTSTGIFEVMPSKV